MSYTHFCWWWFQPWFQMVSSHTRPFCGQSMAFHHDFQAQLWELWQRKFLLRHEESSDSSKSRNLDKAGESIDIYTIHFGRHEENLGFEVWKHHLSYFFPRFEMLIESGKHISFAKEPAWLIRFFFLGVVRLTAHDKTRLGSLKTLQGCFSTHGELVRAPSSNHWVESVSKYYLQFRIWRYIGARKKR